jgi:hypothetical protein
MKHASWGSQNHSGPQSHLGSLAACPGGNTNPVQEKHSKHIDLHYHYIRDVVQDGKVELFFVEGTQNPADMFTKNLGHVKFLKFWEQLGLEFYSPKWLIDSDCSEAS